MKNVTNYAFIDSQNLNLGIKSCGWRLDYKKFRLYLKNKYFVKEAFLFIGHLSGNEALYTYLQRCGYLLIFKPTLEIKRKGGVVIKGNVDAELVLHTMIEINNFEKAVIVSGDGDFHCLVEYLESINKLGKILAPNHKYSSLLRKFNRGNYIQQLNLLKAQLELKKK